MYLQSDSADAEHLYFEAEDGEYFSAGSQLKDIKWADWTCLYGWPVQVRRMTRNMMIKLSMSMPILMLLTLAYLCMHFLVYAPIT